MTETLPKSECACERCQRACSNTPGWFHPGEAEKAAKYLGLSLKQFFDQYLAVNWWEGKDDVPVFVLAPALVGEKTGHEYPCDPKGTCVFFKDGRCEIHPVKPFGCAHGNPCSNEGAKWQKHQEFVTVPLWNKPKHQKQIETLLGRKPEAAEFYGGGILGMFGFGL